ncbi:hypothetical protein BGZ65_012514 [Modicella reniformis]|uniref:Uncharacterized protein n=1 Tax=Modicella reniformis TaxID=1440133 RepID=A0A9P6IKT0_9FUNG|nr:hypothetical protein BGZ65_012514 [Modicella reniformis]
MRKANLSILLKNDGRPPDTAFTSESESGTTTSEYEPDQPRKPSLCDPDPFEPDSFEPDYDPFEHDLHPWDPWDPDPYVRDPSQWEPYEHVHSEVDSGPPKKKRTGTRYPLGISLTHVAK